MFFPFFLFLHTQHMFLALFATQTINALLHVSDHVSDVGTENIQMLLYTFFGDAVLLGQVVKAVGDDLHLVTPLTMNLVWVNVCASQMFVTFDFSVLMNFRVFQQSFVLHDGFLNFKTIVNLIYLFKISEIHMVLGKLLLDILHTQGTHPVFLLVTDT